jgi:hypothetical protein
LQLYRDVDRESPRGGIESRLRYVVFNVLLQVSATAALSTVLFVLSVARVHPLAVSIS